MIPYCRLCFTLGAINTKNEEKKYARSNVNADTWKWKDNKKLGRVVFCNYEVRGEADEMWLKKISHLNCKFFPQAYHKRINNATVGNK